MIDHLSFAVSDLSAALDFYDMALAPLGISRVMQDAAEGPPVAVGYGTPDNPFFWLHADTPAAGPAARCLLYTSDAADELT